MPLGKSSADPRYEAVRGLRLEALAELHRLAESSSVQNSVRLLGAVQLLVGAAPDQIRVFGPNDTPDKESSAVFHLGRHHWTAAPGSLRINESVLEIRRRVTLVPTGFLAPTGRILTCLVTTTTAGVQYTVVGFQTGSPQVVVAVLSPEHAPPEANGMLLVLEELHAPRQP